MHPILINFGFFVVSSWHFFFVLGAMAGYFYYCYLARYSSAPPDETERAHLFMATYISGYFGARVASIIIEQHDVHGIGSWLSELFRLGPMTFYGGMFGGMLAGIVYLQFKRLDIASSIDMAVPAIMLGLGFGRIGCFLNGDDFGRQVEVAADSVPWWAVNFPVLNDNIWRYPVQLMESATAFFLAYLGFHLIRTGGKSNAGRSGVVVAILYAISRFALETFRGDDRGSLFVDVVSPSQLLSLMLITASIFFWLIEVRGRKAKFQDRIF